MVTTVGTETTFEKLVQNLLILEHDALAAYQATIDRLDDAVSRDKIALFKEDHEAHVAELTRMASALGVPAPQEGDLKAYLTKGKVVLAGIVGDKTILKAMSTNEIETRMAYDHASKNAAASPEARAYFSKAHGDEDRHKQWMDAAAAA